MTDDAFAPASAPRPGSHPAKNACRTGLPNHQNNSEERSPMVRPDPTYGPPPFSMRHRPFGHCRELGQLFVHVVLPALVSALLMLGTGLVRTVAVLVCLVVTLFAGAIFLLADVVAFFSEKEASTK